MQGAEAMGARLGLVEDHQLVITGLRECLGSLPEIDEVTAASTVDELLSAGSGPALVDVGEPTGTPADPGSAPDSAPGAAPSPAPDLVLLDLRLADGSRPAENIARLHARGCAVIAYTSGESVPLLREAAAANVLGIISKREPVSVIIEGVRAGLAGEVVASTDWAAAIDADLEATVHLTPREREVLSLYASGEKADSVARHLRISRDTVLDHIRHIRSKYAAVSRPADTKVDLYRRAVEDGLLPGDR